MPEHDFKEVQKLFAHMDVECKFNNVIRLWQQRNDRN